MRGAISIARRLQDPLAELVKIDPKSIGVGQYQHDVQESLLKRKLSEVVESAVNAVGVELNTASAPLLSYVAGVGPSLAKRIVEVRTQKGAFESRAALRDVPGFGPRAFEQAAGFLRVRASANPLDASAVHPERYALVEKIAEDLGAPVAEIIGKKEKVERIDLGGTSMRRPDYSRSRTSSTNCSSRDAIRAIALMPRPSATTSARSRISAKA